MWLIKLGVFFLLAVVMVIVGYQNNDSMEIDVFFWTIETSRLWLVFVSLGVGFLFGFFSSGALHRKFGYMGKRD